MRFIKVNDALGQDIKSIKSSPEEYIDFKNNLLKLISQNEINESEEFTKNNIKTFLHSSLKQKYEINTKQRIDLAIYSENEYSSPISTIIEVKKKSNKFEMMTQQRINTKSLQELILYYLNERIDKKNIQLKKLIITDTDNWYIFDAVDFEKIVYGNKELVNLYKQFINKELSGTGTDFFYKNIAAAFIENNLSSGEINCLCIQIKDYEKYLKSEKYSRNLDNLRKIFSNYFLLKTKVPKPQNKIDKTFYNELLYILGLEEKKIKKEKLIKRLPENERQPASLIENTITQLIVSGKFESMSHSSKYGNNEEEQLFNISLQLIIPWINRILFIKLLEGYLKSIKNYTLNTNILDSKNVDDTHDLQELFFLVLAVPISQRQEYIKEKYKDIPYLNSSLFELTELEKQFFSINALNNIPIQLYKKTKLREKNKSLNIVSYIVKFFENYSFTNNDLDFNHEQLINPSILGLVFEKLNGYKDGSYYTPTNITSLMTSKVIEQTVIDKFNTIKKWNCKNLIDLYNKIDDIPEANNIVESIKICDPAVGSGHFLISALNKLISIKYDLGILVDEDGKRIKDYEIKNFEDELIILDDHSEFIYNPKNQENHRLQKTLFIEKRKLIEKTLFGVDINPNSVNICRLRLWIELLKSSYINDVDTDFPQFETLPNIDINIKQGDSLLSLYTTESNLGEITKDSNYKVQDYKDAITQYINSKSKSEKNNLILLINNIKKSFKNRIKTEQNKLKKKRDITAEIFKIDNQLQLFETSTKRETSKKRKLLVAELKNINSELEYIESRKNIDNIFEWRFEFPEILNENADFIGFDIIIGNPPYFNLNAVQKELYKLGEIYEHVNSRVTNITSLFIYLSLFKLLKEDGYFAFIVPKSITYVESWSRIRSDILSNSTVKEVYDVGKAFEGVGLEQVILICKHKKPVTNTVDVYKGFNPTNKINQDYFRDNDVILTSSNIKTLKILDIMDINTTKLSDIAIFPRGETISSKYLTSVINEEKTLYLGGSNVNQFSFKDGSSRKPNQYVDKVLIRDSQKPVLNNRDKKIIYQNIMSSKAKIVAALDLEKHYTGDTVNNLILTNETFSYEYLLAYLNSPIATYYLKYKIINNATLTVHLDAPYIGKLPIKQIDETTNLKISSLIKRIQLEYSSELHSELNNIIYSIYNIDNDEITLIENDLSW